MKNKHDASKTPCLDLCESAAERPDTETLDRGAILPPPGANGHPTPPPLAIP
jgi:hypothetical protein